MKRITATYYMYFYDNIFLNSAWSGERLQTQILYKIKHILYSIHFSRKSVICEMMCKNNVSQTGHRC